jgi:hypothetical protein
MGGGVVGRPVTPVEPRNCTICGQVIPRGKLTPHRYSRKLACGRECESVLRSAVVRSRYQDDLEARHPCEVCGKPVPRREGEYKSWYIARRTCGHRCWRLLYCRLRTQPLPKSRRCKVCGGRYRPPAHLGQPKHGRERHDWKNRETCSDACWRLLAGQRSKLARESVAGAADNFARLNGLTPEVAKQLLWGRP